MKSKSMIVLFSVVATVFAFAPQASKADDISAALSQALVQEALNSVQALDLINWKVGDTAEMSVSATILSGTMSKSVTKEEGGAVWFKQEAKLSIQNDTVELLMNRADGKVLKMIHNGKEEAYPDEKPTIISQDYTEIDVPAGHFKAIHIVAKTEKVSKIEMWANPRDTVMDGALKEVVATGLIGDMTLELTSFHKN